MTVLWVLVDAAGAVLRSKVQRGIEMRAAKRQQRGEG